MTVAPPDTLPPIPLSLGPNEMRCLNALLSHAVEFLVVGGHAVIVYGCQHEENDPWDDS